MMGSIPDEITAFFINTILPAPLWPWGSNQPKTEKLPGVSPGGRGGE